MTNMHTAAKSISTIQAIKEPVILAYFQSINREEYGQTASLFADNGILHPPFEEEIVGREAIATYLAMDRRLQLVLDCLECEKAPFGKGTLVRFRAALM